MSLEKIKKLEDLKAEAKEILDERGRILKSQRPAAVINLLKEMAQYLEQNSFVINYFNGSERGFNASYGETFLVITASGDDEKFWGADYQVGISGSRKEAVVSIALNTGDYVHPPLDSNIDKVIHDYETRYLPSLKALDNSKLDGSYQLTFNSPGQKTPLNIKNGKEAVDTFFNLFAQ